MSDIIGNDNLSIRVIYCFGVGGWVKPSSLIVICGITAVCPLWKILPTSTLSVEATTCLRIIHAMWVSPSPGGRRCVAFEGSAG